MLLRRICLFIEASGSDFIEMILIHNLILFFVSDFLRQFHYSI